MKNLKARMKKFLASILDDIAVYLITVAGVLFTKFGPPLLAYFRTNRPFDFSAITWLHFAIALVIALALVFRAEQDGKDDLSKKTIRDSKLKKRLWAGFMAGVGYNALVGVFIQGGAS